MLKLLNFPIISKSKICKFLSLKYKIKNIKNKIYYKKYSRGKIERKKNIQEKKETHFLHILNLIKFVKNDFTDQISFFKYKKVKGKNYEILK